MEMGTVNFFSIIVAALAYMILGAIWYSPALFGNAWLRGIGKTREQVTAEFSPVNYVLGLITSFISAYGIARIMAWTGRDSISDGVVIGLLVGICFILAPLIINNVYEKRPKSLTLINALYHTTGFIIIGIIMGAW
jgi:hypothetical protein